MPFFNAELPTKTEPASVSASLRVSKTSSSVFLNFTKAAQEQFFGGPIRGRRFSVQIGHGVDAGKLMMVEDGDFEAAGGIRNSARLRLAAWGDLPKSPRPAGPVKVEKRDGGWLLTLPSWARPDGAGGKLDRSYSAPVKPDKAPSGVSSMAVEGRKKALGR